MDRRSMLKLVGAAAMAAATQALAGPKRRRVRRRVRRRIRRRIRRHVVWRTVGARRLLVVPLAIAVGWELALDSRVVVVQELKPTVVVVLDPKTSAKEELAIVKEDDADNTKELEGSVLASNDTSIPSVEKEEEVEEEVEE